MRQRDCKLPAGRSAFSAGFTLVEVLVSLALMAILIPIAIDAMHVASGAGEIAARRTEAALVAERLLNEKIITGEWNSGLQSGTEYQGLREFPWSLSCVPWTADLNQNSVRLVTVEVGYPAQGKELAVRLSTLVDETQYITNSFGQ